jgi:hypothetical protein
MIAVREVECDNAGQPSPSHKQTHDHDGSSPSSTLTPSHCTNFLEKGQLVIGLLLDVDFMQKRLPRRQPGCMEAARYCRRQDKLLYVEIEGHLVGMGPVANLIVLLLHLVVDPILDEFDVHHAAGQQKVVVVSQRSQRVSQRGG